MIGVSESLKTITTTTMSKALGSTYVFTSTIFTQSEAGIEIKPVNIEYMNIQQNFVDNIVDRITCGCTFFPTELLSILENSQDLKVTFVIRRWDRDIYGFYNSEEPDIMEFNVIIANPQDIIKTLPPVVFKKTVTENWERDILNKPLPLEMQLMSQVDLNIKRPKMNAILADTDIASVILYIANAYKIPKVEISEIENTKKYDQIFIPELTDIATVFPLLQKQCGIYRKGISQYFSNDTLYVYPPYDTNPSRSEIVNIFRLPKGSVDGGDMYHVLEGDDLSIVCFSDVSSKNTAETSTENRGNAVVVKQAESSLGANVDISKSGKLTRNNQSTMIVKVNSTATSTKDQVSTSYGGTTSNIFEQLSELSSGQLEHITITWIHAKPYLIKPGMKCIFHYDDTTAVDQSDVYTTTPGIIEAVVYNLIQHAKDPSMIYRWDATLVIGVAPKKTETTNEYKQTV